MLHVKRYRNSIFRYAWDAIRERGIKCTNVHSHDEALEYVKSKVGNDDLLLTVGAGDVVIVGENI